MVKQLLLVYAVAWVLCCALPGRAAIVSEVLTGPAGGVGPYVELVNLGDEPFDLVMLDANPDRQRMVRWVVTIDPLGHKAVVLHEGDWAWPLPVGAAAIGVGDLDLGQAAVGASRRLVAFAGVTGWSLGTTAPPLDEWTDAAHGLPVVMDVATWQVNGWPVNPLFNEPVQAIVIGDALSRHRDETGHLPSWSTGPVDEHLQFLNGSSLTPGAINDPLTLPEPVAWPLLSAVGLAFGRRTKKPAAR